MKKTMVSQSFSNFATKRKLSYSSFLLLFVLVSLFQPKEIFADQLPSLWSYQFAGNNPGSTSDIQHGESDGVLTICEGTVVDIFGKFSVAPNTTQLVQWVGAGAPSTGNAPDVSTTGSPGSHWSYIGTPVSTSTATLSISFNNAGTYYYSVVGTSGSSFVDPGEYWLIIEVEEAITASAALSITNNICTDNPSFEIGYSSTSTYTHEIIVTDENGNVNSGFVSFYGTGSVDLANLPYLWIEENHEYTIKHIMTNSCNGKSSTIIVNTYGPVVESNDITVCPGGLNPVIVVTDAPGSIPSTEYILYNDNYAGAEIASNSTGVFYISTLLPGTHTFYVKGESEGECISEDFTEVTITVYHPIPTYNYQDISYCLPDGPTSVIFPSVSGAGNATHFELSINGTLHSSSTTGGFLINESNFNYGVNNCSVTIYSPCGNTTATFTVTEGQVPVLFGNNMELCYEDIPSAGLDINLASGAPFSGYISYTGPGVSTVGGANMFTYTIPKASLPVGTHTVWVDAYDDFGCRLDKQLKITIKVLECKCDVRLNFHALYNGDDKDNQGCSVEFKPIIVLGSDMTMLSQDWDYGDGSSATNPPSPNIHTYTGLGAPTVFTVCFTVTAKNNISGKICKVTICHNVAVDCRNMKVTIKDPLGGAGKKANETEGNGLVFKSDEMNMYPNPTEGEFSIELDIADEASSQISIYSVLGTEVLNTTISGQTAKVDLSQMASGVYVVRVKTGSQIRQGRIMLK